MGLYLMLLISFPRLNLLLNLIFFHFWVLFEEMSLIKEHYVIVIVKTVVDAIGSTTIIINTIGSTMTQNILWQWQGNNGFGCRFNWKSNKKFTILYSSYQSLSCRLKYKLKKHSWHSGKTWHCNWKRKNFWK